MTTSDRKALDKMLRQRRVALMGGVRAMKQVAKLARNKDEGGTMNDEVKTRTPKPDTRTPRKP